MICKICGKEMYVDENSGKNYWVCDNEEAHPPQWIEISNRELVE